MDCAYSTCSQRFELRGKMWQNNDQIDDKKQLSSKISLEFYYKSRHHTTNARELMIKVYFNYLSNMNINLF